MITISDLELGTMETAARVLSAADRALDADVSTESTGRYLLASRELERLVTAGALLSLIAEVRRCRQWSNRRALAAEFGESAL
jgi:hypothetical protein